MSGHKPKGKKNSRSDRNKLLDIRENEWWYERDVRERADNLIREEEASKARLLEPRGNILNIDRRNNNSQGQGEGQPRGRLRQSYSQDDGYESEEEDDIDQIRGRKMTRPLEVDQNFLVVGNHVEEPIQTHIENGEYVDFARLLLRD